MQHTPHSRGDEVRRSRSDARRTVLLNLQYPSRASYYEDWLDAFAGSGLFECDVVNILSVSPTSLARRLDEFDTIIMLHSTNSDTLDYFEAIADVLADRKRAQLIIFAGNEYNSPYVSMTRKVGLFSRARADIVATQLLQEAGEFLYGGHGYRVISVPHALNPAAFKPGQPHAQRRLDIGVKGFMYPAYLGDEDRNRIVKQFQQAAEQFDLSTDIGVDSRLSRDHWAAFLGDCRGTISTETGTWFLERDDTTVKRIHEYLGSKRKGFVISNEGHLRRLARLLPSQVKQALWGVLKKGPVRFEPLDDFNTPFAEIYDRFFRDRERPAVYGKAISSRHFDAIGTKTCQIMLKGRFNDLLVAGEHYIAVEPDFSNLDDAISRFKDAGYREQLVAKAYDHVLASHTHAHRVASVAHALDEVRCDG